MNSFLTFCEAAAAGDRITSMREQVSTATSTSESHNWPAQISSLSIQTFAPLAFSIFGKTEDEFQVFAAIADEGGGWIDGQFDLLAQEAARIASVATLCHR